MDGSIVSDNAVYWLCTNDTWHGGASDAMKGAMLALGELRKEVAASHAIEQSDIILTAYPLNTSGLPDHVIENYAKLGISNWSVRVKPEAVHIALDLINHGLVLHVDQSQLQQASQSLGTESTDQAAMPF